MALPHFCETQFSKEEKKGKLALVGLVSNDKLDYKLHQKMVIWTLKSENISRPRSKFILWASEFLEIQKRGKK